MPAVRVSAASDMEQRVRRKTRRGKKNRKMKKSFDFELKTDNTEGCLSCKINLDSDPLMLKQKGFVRPISKPSAPKNSTQFLLYDRELYDKRPNFDCAESRTPSPVQQTVESEYSSPDDMDTFTFMLNDFEDVFAEVRLQEISRRPKSDLVQDYNTLLFKYERSMNEVEQLQEELTCQNAVALSTENCQLREENERLLQELQRLTARYRV